MSLNKTRNLLKTVNNKVTADETVSGVRLITGTTNTVVNTWEQHVHMSSSLGAHMTASLPTGGGVHPTTGVELIYTFKDVSGIATAQPMLISGSTLTIDGATGKVIGANFGSITVQYNADKAAWFVVGGTGSNQA